MSNEKTVNAVNTVSNERLEDLIKEAIAAAVADPDNDIKVDEFDVTIRKELGQPITIEIRVYGMAGNTTKDEFVDASGKVVKGGGSLVITLDDDTHAKFAFKEVLNLDSTDYQVTYVLA